VAQPTAVRVSFVNRQGCACLDGYTVDLPQTFPGDYQYENTACPLSQCPSEYQEASAFLRCRLGVGDYWEFAYTESTLPAGQGAGLQFRVGGNSGDIALCYAVTPPVLSAVVQCGPPFFLRVNGVRVCVVSAPPSPPCLCPPGDCLGEVDVIIMGL
jgi:hypothetical protein